MKTFALLFVLCLTGILLIGRPLWAADENVPTISSQELSQMIAQKTDFFLLDVRQNEEFAEGHIDGAKLIPLSALAQHASELPKDKKMVVYCRSGKRSAAAVSYLRSHGYEQAVSLEGGFLAWSAVRK